MVKMLHSPVSEDDIIAQPRTNCKRIYFSANLFGYMCYLTYKKSPMTGIWESGYFDLSRSVPMTPQRKYRKLVHFSVKARLVAYQNDQQETQKTTLLYWCASRVI